MTDQPQDAFEMSPEQATAALEKMAQDIQGVAPSSTTPGTPAEARARLDALSKNSEFRDRYFNGDASARQEIANLDAMLANADDRLDAVLSGTATSQAIEVTTDENPLTTGELAGAVEDLRAHSNGTDSTIKIAVQGGGVTRAEYEEALMAKQSLLGNAEWTKKYLAGDYQAVADMQLVEIVLNGYRPE